MFNQIKPREFLDTPDKTYANIDFNTVILFNKFGFKKNVLTVYLICKILKREISPQRVKKYFDQIEKIPTNNFKIVSALNKLKKYGYLNLNKFGNYSVTKQVKINSIYKSYLSKNFYNKHFIIDIYSLKYFLFESKETSWYDYLNSSLLVNLWWNTPTTLSEIKKVTGLTRNKVKSLKVKSEYFKKIYNDPRYSAYKNTKFNIITLGKVYQQEYNPIKISKNNFIDKKFFAVMTNTFKKINDKLHLITTNDIFKKLEKSFRLPISFKNRRFARLDFSCMNDIKKNFIETLSVNYLNSRIKSGTLVLQY